MAQPQPAPPPSAALDAAYAQLAAHVVAAAVAVLRRRAARAQPAPPR